LIVKTIKTKGWTTPKVVHIYLFFPADKKNNQNKDKQGSKKKEKRSILSCLENILFQKA